MIYEPPWLQAARDEARAGVLEIPGEEHHPRILAYHSTCTLKATSDEVPWCSAFVNWCFWSVGIVHRANSARARSWLNWGVKLNPDYPAFGCVAVLKRGGPGQPGPAVIDAQGHVGFFVDRPTPTEVIVLGGNQSNQVCERTYPVERILGYRWAA